MADLATLGLEVQSGPVEQGARSLDKLTGAAHRAEAAANGVTSSMKSAAAVAVSNARANHSAAAAKLAAARASETATKEDIAAAAAAKRLTAAALASAKAEHDRVAASLAAASAMEREAAAAAKSAAQVNTLAGASRRASVAVNDNARRMGGSMSGLAAQFQDVGVTAAAGLNPMIIGLQQGTQIAGQMEVALASGGSAAGVFGAALRSLISPVSLVSIGLTVLLAAGFQMVDWASVAQGALNAVADSLVTIAPYATLAAGGLALLYAPAIIGGLVTVVTSLGSVATAVYGIATAIYATVGLPALLIAGFVALVAAAVIWRDDITRMLGFDIVQAAQDGINSIIGFFVGGFKAIKDTWGLLPAAMGDLVTTAARKVIDGIEGMVNKTIGLLNDLTNRFALWRASIGQPLSPEAFNNMIIGPVHLPKPENAQPGAAGNVADIIRKDFADQQGKNFVGGIVTTIQTGASAAADKLRELAAGLTGVDDAEGGVAKSTKAANDNLKDQKGVLAGLTNAYNSAKGIFTGFFSDVQSGLRQGMSLWDAFAQAALNALNSILDAILKNAANGLFNALFNAGGGNLLGSLFGLFSANGNVFDHSGLVAFANGGVVNRPTIFPFAGGIGLMGEAGPEAIMPLRRGPDGRLGVAASNNNASLDVHVTVDVADDGKLVAFVDRVSRRNAGQAVADAAPRILSSANATAPAAVAAYQRDVAGGDYRVA